jgi:murein L,D-transpeptidase YafK
LFAAATLAAAWTLALPSAYAVSIELKDVAPDRVERQRAAAEGRLQLANAPDTSRTGERLAAKGLKLGSAVFIRIFKAQSELEIWMEKDGAFVHFDTYPICHWSGTLGPKIRQGDKQAPEGFYTVTSRQLHRFGRWPGSLNLGYPNAFDRSQARDGSYILVHGGCSSAGCFAMTNQLIGEIYKLSSAALESGQRHVPVHVFPFRMTDDNLAHYKDSGWIPFWMNLKEGYDAFERTRRPPRVSVCNDRYAFQAPGLIDGVKPGPIAVCGQTASLIEGLDKFADLVPPAAMRQVLFDSRAGSGLAASLIAPSLRAGSTAALAPLTVTNFNTPRRATIASGRRFHCSPGLPSCRRFMALQSRAAHRSAIASAGRPAKRRLAAGSGRN